MFNQATIIGNLGRDPEVRSVQGGDKVANLRVATTESWRDKSSGERKERTEWHNVVIWGALADVAEKYLTKGSKAMFQGKLQTRTWEKDGKTNYTTEIVLQGYTATLKLLDGARSGSASGDTSSKHDAAKRNGYQPEVEDEIPF